MDEEKFVETSHLRQMVRNFKEKVYGIDISVDINHDPSSGAAGWFKDLEIRPSSRDPDKQALWGLVKWSEFGRTVAGPDKRYKYISAEFGPWTNPETKETFKD
ncbi:MAG TPA: phage protease, partial [Phycisphaerae bacterium]|nr:phage protease [Phycisphaerae bacterium]